MEFSWKLIMKDNAEKIAALNWVQLSFALGMGVFVAVIVYLIYKLAIGATPAEAKAKITKEALPLITSSIIIAAIYSLAILDKVQENTVAAIYGAVAGYVLGRGRE